MSASDSPTTAPTTPYQLVTEWTRFQKKGAGPLPLENFKLDKQQLKDLKTRYEKGINAVARLIDNHQHIDTAVAATAVLHLYTELPCVGKLKNFCVPDLTFESLHLILDKNLKEWANDDIIDCCAQVLCRAAYRTEDQVARSANLVRTPSKTFILRTHVFQSFVHPTAGTFIENESSRQAMLTHPWFRCLKSQLEQSHDAVIYLPITLNNLHWIAAKLDVSTGIWSFADSMNFSSIPTVYFDSCILLSKMLGISSPQTQPPLCNATFRSGVQVDGHSCGYFALNAIEADLFGTPLASTSTRTYQRLRTFWMICQEHVEDHGPVVNGRVQFGAGRQAETMEDGMFDLDQFHSPTLHKVGQQLRRLKSHLFPTQVVQPIHDQTSPPTQSTVQPLAECSAVIPKSFSVPSSLPIEDASAYREVESVDESDTEDETDTSDMLWSDTEYMEIDASDCIQEKPSGRKRQPLQRSNAFLPPVLEKGEKDDIVAPVQSAYALLQNSTATIETTRTTGKPMSKIVNRNKNTARAEERPDLWNRFVRRVKEAAPAAKVDKQLWPKHVWCPACRKWTPLKAVFQVSDFVKHYKDCIKDYPAVCLETQEPIEPVSATRLELASKSKKVTSKPSTQIGRAIISHSTKSIASFFSAVPKPGGKVSVSYPGRPCPGLSDAFDPRIGVYLGRTGAGGGGAPVLKVIIGKARLQLISMQRARMKSQKSAITGPAYSAADLKGLVNLLREKNYKWINHKNLGLVRAAACTGEANRIGLPCDPCRSLRTNKIFTNALQREPPASDKVKYTPNYYVKGFLHELALQYHGLDRLFDPKGKQSVMLRFATMLHDDQAGENKYEIYRGMSEAIYHTQERKSRGKGTQGLVRNQLFVNTMHSLALMSAYAYRKLHKLFSGPTIRYLKLQRQNMPAFRLGIDPENFDIAAKLLDGNGDTSPLCLSVDDTALVPKLRSLYDTQRETWSLVGHVSDTGNTAFGADLIFDREVDVRAAIQENVLKRGTKMRGYLLTSNTPGTPSILLAAFPIGDLITAEQLLPPMKEVIRQLERVGLAKRVISIVSDGAPTEVAAQNEMMRIYTRQETRLPPPSDRFGEIVIDYMMIGETKTITLVDAKHTSKNSMNAQCTGARVLVLGDHTVTYSQLLEIIQTSGSPLFKGDVVKSDRQDDQRMERYLSPDTMDHVVTNMPGDLGFQVYLYIFGELHSAVQSRSLCNAERMQMLLTTEYFLQGWQTFIQQHPDYGPPQFLPHAFFKLVKRLIRGVIGMILLLRDAGADGQVPLLPWRHMTETLEHYFGTARRFVQEFDAVQFAQLSKKISLLIDFEVGGAMGIFDEAAEEARSRRGYQHTYHIGTDLDVTSLATYPTESDVRTISLMAGNTAGDLLCALGMRVEWDLGPARALTIGQTEDFNLMVDNQDEADQVQENDEVTSEGEFKVFLDGYLKNMDPGYDTMLEEMINSATNMDTSQKTRETVAEVALAVTALEVETDANLDALPTVSEDDLQSACSTARVGLQNEMSNIRRVGKPPQRHVIAEVELACRLPIDEESEFYRPGLDHARMISLRRLHAAAYSRTASKGRRNLPKAKDTEDTQQEQSGDTAGGYQADHPTSFLSVQQSRQSLHSRLIKQLEEEGDVAGNIVPGGNRQQRYRGKINSQRPETHNETEKRVVFRDHRVTKAEGIRLRQFSFWASQVDYRQGIAKGGVSHASPLRPLDLVVFVADGKWVGKGKKRECEGRISLGIVLTMYEQDAPGNPHAHVPEGDSLAKLSFIVVQELKQIASNIFTPFIHDSPSPSFHHLSSYRIIEKVGKIFARPQLGPSCMVTVPRKAHEVLRLWQTQRASLLPCAVSNPARGVANTARVDVMDVIQE